MFLYTFIQYNMDYQKIQNPNLQVMGKRKASQPIKGEKNAIRWPRGEGDGYHILRLIIERNLENKRTVVERSS